MTLKIETALKFELAVQVTIDEVSGFFAAQFRPPSAPAAPDFFVRV